MPIRQVEMDDNLRIWRSFSIGTLFDLIMLDTRQYDRSITDLYWVRVHEPSSLTDPLTFTAPEHRLHPSDLERRWPLYDG